MPRICCALVSLLSMLIVSLSPLRAQTQTAASLGNVLHESGANDPITVGPEETRQDVGARDRDVVLSGHVLGDVLVVNGHVTVLPGASVGGTVVAIGGHVTNEAGPGVRVAEQGSGVLSAIAAPAAIGPGERESNKGWLGGQVALLLLGLLSAAVFALAGPRVTNRTAALMAEKRARCIVTGGLLVPAGLVGILFSAALEKSALKLLWLPFHLLIALVVALLLAGGWLCGMRYVGDRIARRFGRPEEGPAFTRMALGLITFFLVNIALGAVNPHLGGLGLLAEGCFGVLGLGAFVMTLRGNVAGRGASRGGTLPGELLPSGRD